MLFDKNMSILFYFVLCSYFGLVVSYMMECNITKKASDEQLLKRDLQCDYDIYARPRQNSQESVNVTVKLVVKNFHFLDTDKTYETTEASLSIGVWVVLTWNDDYLQWNPKDYGNHDETVIWSHSIWNPDISLYNSIAGTEMGQNIGFTIPCLIKNTGKVTCIPHMVYQTTCKANYKKWPVDTQNCSMTFGTWMHKGEEVRFQLSKAKPMSINGIDSNAYWKVNAIGTQSNSGEYECCPNTTYPTISFWLLLQRRSSNELLFLVTPAVVKYFRDSTYLACAVLIEGILLKSVLKRADVVPRWVSTITNFSNSGAGKIIMFHEFDPAASEIISGDPESLTKEEMELISKRDWLKFSLLINRVFLIVIVITYVGLFFALMLF